MDTFGISTIFEASVTNSPYSLEHSTNTGCLDWVRFPWPTKLFAMRYLNAFCRRSFPSSADFIFISKIVWILLHWTSCPDDIYICSWFYIGQPKGLLFHGFAEHRVSECSQKKFQVLFLPSKLNGEIAGERTNEEKSFSREKNESRLCFSFIAQTIATHTEE